MHGATDYGATITGTPFVAHGDDDGGGDGDDGDGCMMTMTHPK